MPNVVAGPGAMRLTGVTVDQLHDPILPSHYEMVCGIRRQLLDWKASLYIGHNSLRFDEVLLRSAFYKNLMPPYLTNLAGSSRIDTLSMVQWAHKYEPIGITIPTRPDGQLIFRLEQLAPANGYNHARAHDAMSDVQATIHLARLARLPQLGGREDANPLIFHNRTSKGRRYRAPNGGGESRALRRRSAVRAVAAGSCRAGAEGARAPCSAGCGAAGRGAGRRRSADGHPPSGWRRAPR